MSRYVALLAVALGAAGVLALVTRLPRPTAVASRTPAEPTAVAVALEVVDGALRPASAAVPKNHRVRLQITNRGAREVRVTLSGYEDRLMIGALAPGVTWRGEFLADRPGDDFAWLLDGLPAGRFQVLGSHLVEGHR